MQISRYFTDANVDPYSGIKWETRSSSITAADGTVVASVDHMTTPSTWSQLATDIVATKYANKKVKESSVKEIVERIVGAITMAGQRSRHLMDEVNRDAFHDELAYILLNQVAAFNSPVWFNVGLCESYGITGSASGSYTIDGIESAHSYVSPQCSACFIQSVEDDLLSFYDLLKTQARLFKYGSGSGSNFSNIRGIGEKLSSGGTSSGVMSFLPMFDASAGAIKSGGTTRRSSMLVCLDIDHPEIEAFINWKAEEEKKAQALIAQGYESDFNGEAYRTVGGQNSNNSVRLSDAFMQAVETRGCWDTYSRTTEEKVNTYSAQKLWDLLAEAAWKCGDPGVQFDDTINAWHTCPHEDRINASNPCQPSFATVLTPTGIRAFKDIDVGSIIWSGNQWTTVVRKVFTGHKPVYRYHTTAGTFIGTENHRVFQEGQRVEAKDAKTIDVCLGELLERDFDFDKQTVMDGCVIGDGSVHKASQNLVYLCAGMKDQDVLSELSEYVGKHRYALGEYAHEVTTTVGSDELPHTYDRKVPARFKHGDRRTVCSFLRGLYAANGTVVGGRVTLKAASIKVIQDVQEMLSGLGIRSYYTTNKSHPVKFSNGTYQCKQSYDLGITHGREAFMNLIGFIHKHKAEKAFDAIQKVKRNYVKTSFEVVRVEDLGEMPVYDITVDADEHSYWTGGLLVSNCSEYMFLDDSACNLASINLCKFLDDDNRFDVEGFSHVCRVMIIAQDILASHSSYPTKKIADNTRRFRPLGLGHANLGGFLMSLGIPYDSDAARGIAAGITALMTAVAYATSAAMADELGVFPGSDGVMLEIISKHLDHAMKIENCPDYILTAARRQWHKTWSLGVEHGFRNAQVTVIAPTGTIGLLMDCATTGLEPDYSLVKVKKLAGGGSVVIVNPIVQKALKTLGYSEDDAKQIEEYVLEHGMIEGAPKFYEGHLPVFDCAAKCGSRSISPMGHLRMVASVQPFVSGGISKTINLSNEATVEDVKDIYWAAWKMGVKSITVYRDGCKASQPLNTGKPTTTVASNGGRRKLHSKRSGWTQAARVAGHKIYLRTGEYPDGTLGEIFVDMHKEGSSFASLMQCFARAVSIGLQYGVPLSTYVDHFIFTKFDPQGPVSGHDNIKFSNSVVDYIFRVLGLEYLNKTDIVHVVPDVASVEGDTPFCSGCGHLTVRNGTCFKCVNCGTSLGCS